MIYLTRTVLLSVLMTILAAVSLGQTKIDCPTLGDPFNDSSVISVKHDSRGNVVENIAYSPSGKPARKLKWEYDYDDKGNWIGKCSFEWHYWDQGLEYTLVAEEVRTITYADRSKK